MSEQDELLAQIAEMQARLKEIKADESNQATAQQQNEQAYAEGYEGSPPPGEWAQDPEAEKQFDEVTVDARMSAT